MFEPLCAAPAHVGRGGERCSDTSPRGWCHEVEDCRAPVMTAKPFLLAGLGLQPLLQPLLIAGHLLARLAADERQEELAAEAVAFEVELERHP
jgi:hypothetical protein